MRKVSHMFILTLLLTISLTTAAFAASGNFPKTIPLPIGFRPEGIVVGKGTDFYVGSLANGAIFKGDLRTGEGAILNPGGAGKVSVGLTFDESSGYLFVSGGNTGTARVIDTRSGTEIASYTLGAGFINDAVVTKDAVYFTNSAQPVLYKIPLSKNGTEIGTVQTLALSGDWQQVAGFNANGIDATSNGKQLIVVNSTTGFLYLVDPNSGVADQIDLGGEVVTAGDGILLDGKTLYVLRNQFNLIAVIELSSDLTSGKVVGGITDPLFRVPTTLDEFGNRLYAVNARFGITDPNTADYDVVQVSK